MDGLLHGNGRSISSMDHLKVADYLLKIAIPMCFLSLGLSYERDPSWFNLILYIFYADFTVQTILAKFGMGHNFKCPCKYKIRGIIPFFVVDAFRIKLHERSCLVGIMNKDKRVYGWT